MFGADWIFHAGSLTFTDKDFQALKMAVLKQGDALPAQRQYATLAWTFLLGFASKKLGDVEPHLGQLSLYRSSGNILHV